MLEMAKGKITRDDIAEAICAGEAARDRSQDEVEEAVLLMKGEEIKLLKLASKLDE